jgi:hypothetical protein
MYRELTPDRHCDPLEVGGEDIKTFDIRNMPNSRQMPKPVENDRVIVSMQVPKIRGYLTPQCLTSLRIYM